MIGMSFCDCSRYWEAVEEKEKHVYTRSYSFMLRFVDLAVNI